MSIEDAQETLTELGMNINSSGNISIRDKAVYWITGSGKNKQAVKLPGEEKRASSEWPMHKAIYDARPDINAIVHCHSIFATAVACCGLCIPEFHYQIAAAGRAIPCVRYLRFGSQELAEEVATNLKNSNACLLSGHGQVAVAENLEKAIALAIEVEWLAKVYCISRTLAGACHSGVQLLSEEDLDDAVKRYGGYLK